MKIKIFYLIILLFIFINSKAQIISTIAGKDSTSGFCSGSYTGNGGPATNATLNNPGGICFDTAGNLYISDQCYLRIRKINTAGIISLYAGNGNTDSTGDGGPATAAAFESIIHIMADNKGNLFVPDQFVARIRRINAAGIISTYAGDSIFGHTGNGGPANAAEIGSVSGIAFDKKGNLYYADNTRYIMKINTAGVLTTIGGNGVYGYGGDGGPATNALLKWPTDITIDKKGNIYFTDQGNNNIRKIDTFGIISTIAGSDTAGGYSGDNGQATAAKLWAPEGIIIDAIGNVYFSDELNNVVRKIDSAGIITTIVGNGTRGFSGDGGPATAAQLNNPAGLSFDKRGNLYIADWLNNRVRKVTNVGVMVDEVREVVGGSVEQQYSLYPNPNDGNLTLLQTVLDTKTVTIEVLNAYGQTVKTDILQFSNNAKDLHLGKLPVGIYLLHLRDSESNMYNLKFEIQ